MKYGAAGFQGKGFRSLGQEAIYACAIRLNRGAAFRKDNQYTGDVVAPLIRDLGAALAMRPDEDGVRQVLSAQMGKAGPPMNGRDAFVAWMATNRGENPQFLAQRWGRYEALLRNRDLSDQRNMRAFLMTTKGLSEDEAISLMSIAVDFGVTQVVDGNWGVHAIIRKSLFAGAEAGGRSPRETW